MSAGRHKERPRLMASHDSKMGGASRPGLFSNSYHGEQFSQQHYGMISSKPRPLAVEPTPSAADGGPLAQDMYEHNRRMPPASLPGRPHHHPEAPYPQPHPSRLDMLPRRERSHPSHMFMDHPLDSSPEKRNAPLHPPPIESLIAPVPKKGRYHDGTRLTLAAGIPVSWNQPLRIDTSMDSSKIKMEPPGGYHPETEAISPTQPTESHDSKSDIVHSINEVDREINLIENQIQQLQKKEWKLEAEAAKPKEDIAEEDATCESKPLSIAQIVYKENRKLAHQSHVVLFNFGAPTDLPVFHQPCDAEVFHENVTKFETFKSVLQSYFKKKAAERMRTESYMSETYEKLVTSWLKKADAKTIKKNIKDLKTREYFEKVFPEIKKAREDKERITSRVGARGVSSGYARTEAEFEQIIDGINEQEEEDKKMRAYAIIPPMLNQTQRKLSFVNRNGLIPEPKSDYKDRKQTTNWSTEEKEVFKEKYLERPKQFGHIADLLEKKTLNDCVLYYYMSKKTENFKQLLKKQVKRPPRRPQMKPSIRHSNEGLGLNSEATSGAIKTGGYADDQDIVRVTRSTIDESRVTCCAACGVKLESYSVSHAVTRSTCSQFGLDAENFQPDWRVCATCAKLRRRKFKTCPIPSCTTPRRRIRHLPIKWDQLPVQMKDTIMTELHMEEEVNRCCSSCYDKISDLLMEPDNDEEGNPSEGLASRWTEENIYTLKEGIRLHGKQWPQLAASINGKSEAQCRMYFYRNKKKLGLDVIYNEFRKRKSEELGHDLDDPSDDSADEDDDDNMEDNDLSSDNEGTPTTDVQPKSPIAVSAVPTTETSDGPVVKELKSDFTAWDTKPAQLATFSADESKLENGVMLDAMTSKTESKDVPGMLIKPEKVEYDNSATDSADEAQDPVVNLALGNEKTLAALSKAVTFIKQEPGLMSNPDGMLASGDGMRAHQAQLMSSMYAKSSSANANAGVSLTPQQHPHPQSQHPHPHSSQSNPTSTSVKDLIDLAIEDALANTSSAETNNTVVAQRQSVISQCLPQNTSSSASSSKQNAGSQQPQDLRLDVQSHSSPRYNMGNKATDMSRLVSTHSRPNIKDDLMTRRQTPFLPYEGDPRAFMQATKRDVKQPFSIHGARGTDNNQQIRAPPPAHSQQPLMSSQLDMRNTPDRKSPAIKPFNAADAPFAVYDGKSGAGDSRMSPHGRQPIGQPPPLISSGLTHHSLPPHMSHIKKENSHAGGSILQGTSASHSQPPPNRFEAGSISHGTPRSQPDSKSLSASQLSRSDDRISRSPRSQAPVHSPALPSQQQQQQQHQQQHYGMLMEQQQQQQQQLLFLQDAVRRGQIPPALFPQMAAAASFPALTAYEPYQTKSVLQNDFLTAKQMSAASVNLAVGASAYSSALDKDKGGKASPHPKDQLFAAAAAGLNPAMIDQHAMMMLINSRVMTPRMMGPDRQRLLTASNAAVTSSASPLSKDDINRSWAPHVTAGGSHALANHSRPEQPRLQKPSIMQGMIPKPVESLHRSEVNRRSVSPHVKRDTKTRYEKDLEEMNMRSLTERTRTDSERTLTDTESSQPAYVGSNRVSADHYGVPRSSSIDVNGDPDQSHLACIMEIHNMA